MRDLLFILDEAGEPQPIADTLEWAEWFEANNATACRIADTEFGGVRVSTIFLGAPPRCGLVVRRLTRTADVEVALAVAWWLLLFGGIAALRR